MPHAWTFDAIGTSWQVDADAPVGADVRAQVTALVEDFDRTWSRFRPDSLVTRMAERAGSWHLPHADRLLGWFDRLVDATGGAVNPLVGRSLADLGYDADYSLRPVADPAGAAPGWASVQRSGPVVTVTTPVLLDVGAAGKGLLVDLVADLLHDAGVAAVVDAGGDVRNRGSGPIRVALEHPADPTRALGVVELASGSALCGSATNRRAWGEGLHHVLDARTGRPTNDVIATWVVTDESCMQADGLATAHFLAPADQLAEDFRHHFVRVHADGRVVFSSDLPGEIF